MQTIVRDKFPVHFGVPESFCKFLLILTKYRPELANAGYICPASSLELN